MINFVGATSVHMTKETQMWRKYRAYLSHPSELTDDVNSGSTSEPQTDVTTNSQSNGFGWGQVSPSPVSCPENWHNFYSSGCYFVAYPHYDNHEDSQTECNSEQAGSYLAELTTTDEFDAVVQGARDVMEHL